MKLKEICEYISDRVAVTAVSEANYISTENMAQNKGGVTKSSSIPSSGAVIRYKNDDILISNIRPYFKKIWQADKTGGCSADVLCIRAKKHIDSTFLYYLLSQDAFFEYVMTGAKGCKMPRGDKGHIMDWEIDIPEDKSEQTAIGQCLKMLDKKIEINKQINDNLVQQAEGILSNWLENYDLKQYKLSDICYYVTEKIDTSKLGTENYISTENMNANKMGIQASSGVPKGKATAYDYDDILVANIRPYFKKIWKASKKGGCSADVLCIRALDSTYSSILFWLLRQDSFFDYVMTGAKGSKMPRGDKSHIMNWSIELPDIEYWSIVESSLRSIDERMALHDQECIKLTQLRDTILPKLISGELKINDLDC